jgi:hypothetical protein
MSETDNLTQDVTIRGARFQIKRFGALEGSWVVAQMFTRILPSNLESQLGGSVALPAGRATMTEEEFINLQKHCLQVCFHYTEGAPPSTPPLPVLRNGQIAIPELVHDPLVIMALTIRSLKFNMLPFFSEGALDLLLGPLRDLSLFNASK